MLPRLRAEESLNAAESTGLGTGSFDREAARKLSNDLCRKAQGGGRVAVKAKPEELPLVGIGYRVVETTPS